jgi:peptide deformylase
MNPAIQSKDKLIIYREEDPLTGKEYFIPRFTQISLVFQDCLGKVRGLKMNEAASIIVCQAMDALNGILISDYGLEVLPEFDSASEEEKKEVLSMYAESLSQAYKELDADLSNNEETKKT